MNQLDVWLFDITLDHLIIFTDVRSVLRSCLVLIQVIIEWSLVIINLMLEIPSCVFDQISSTQKPLYALAAMSMSFCNVNVIFILSTLPRRSLS